MTAELRSNSGSSGQRLPFVLGPDESVFHDDPRVTRTLLDRLRADGHDLATDATGGVLWVLRADDADQILALPEVRAELAMEVLHVSGVTEGPLHDLWSDQMFGKDGAQHRRLRQSVARVFTPRAVSAWRPSVESIATELVSSWTPGAVVDASPTFAVPLAARVFCLVLGVPESDAQRIASCALQLVRAFGILPPDAVGPATAAAADVMAYLDEHLAAAAAPERTVLHTLTHDAGDLSARETRAVAANVVFGGLDATAKAIATGLALLLDDDAAWSGLTADPAARTPAAVAEVLRLSPPVAGVARRVVSSAVCRGVELRPAQIVVSSFDAVCRDLDHVDRPDQLDIDRAPGKQYVFGFGPHYCLGANLAKVVLEVALQTLATQCPGLRLACRLDRLPWAQNPVRGIVSVPVRIPPQRPGCR